MSKINYSNVKFPLKAKFVRHENRIYTIMDFRDGEELRYYGKCEKPSSNANGYRFYTDNNGHTQLVHYTDIIAIN